MVIPPGEETLGLPIGADAAQAAYGLILQSARRAPAMHELLELLRRLARDDAPAWICGELGAGRHTAALALHALSGRKTGPLLLVHGSELGAQQGRARPHSQAPMGSPPEPWPPDEARQRLEELLHHAAGGTLVIDEGGVQDLDLQLLLADVLRAPLRARLLLITALPGRNHPRPGGSSENTQVPPVLSRELAARLAQRCVRVPALRQRAPEVVTLAVDLLRAYAEPPPAPAAPPEPAAVEDAAEPEQIGPAAEVAEAAEGTEAVEAGAEVEAQPAPAAPPELSLTDEAATVLAEHPFPGNLWQLDLGMRRLARSAGSSGPVVSAEDLRWVLASPQQPDSAHDPNLLYQLGQALGELLRTLLPVQPPHSLSGQVDPEQAVHLQRAPLLLYQDPLDPPWLQRLRRGPGSLDDARLVAGLQARPLGKSAGTRTGDAPVLGRLGPTWRGHMLGLLRAAYKELDDQRAPSLSLLSLGQLLLLAGPPIPADKLVRLALGLPVDLLEDETAAMLERLGLAPPTPRGRSPGRGLPGCVGPAVGRHWADAVRGLLPHSRLRVFREHAEVCERCSQVLLGFWRLPDLQTAVRQEVALSPEQPQGAAPAAPDGEEYTILDEVQPGGPRRSQVDTVTLPTVDKTETRIGTARPPVSLFEQAARQSAEAPLGGLDGPLGPGHTFGMDPTQEVSVGIAGQAGEESDPEAPPTVVQRVQLPVVVRQAPTFLGVLTGAHWLALLLLLGIALCIGVLLAGRLQR